MQAHLVSFLGRRLGSGTQALPFAEQTGQAFFAQPIALAFDGNDVAVVEQPVQDGRGQDVVAEHLAPVPHRLVAGEDDAAPLVAAVHQLEQQVRRLTLKGQEPDLVDLC